MPILNLVRILDYNQDVVCGCIPQKRLFLENLLGLDLTNMTLEEIQSKILSFNYNVSHINTMNNGFMQVDQAATGFMCIRRNVLEQMMEKYPEQQYIESDIPSLYTFFDCVIDESKKYLSEDFAFCEKWRAIGGKIWIDTTQPLTHCGTFKFKGNLKHIINSDNKALHWDNESFVKFKYHELCTTPSDINEHLPTLARYASECSSIFETGVRCFVSSWALLFGLLKSEHPDKKYFLNDINECPIEKFLINSKNLPVKICYEWKNNLDLVLTENFDLTFIDTWHVYGQLKRELAKFSNITNKYIILHDTTVDADLGETIRLCLNPFEQSKETGIPVDEICRGIWPALTEFLESNTQWVLQERFTNNNGLTILKRVTNS
jgi:hypothetical protein